MRTETTGTCAYLRACMHVCLCASVCVCVCLCVCTRTHIAAWHVHVRTLQVCTGLSMCMRVRVCTCLSTHIHSVVYKHSTHFTARLQAGLLTLAKEACTPCEGGHRPRPQAQMPCSDCLAGCLCCRTDSWATLNVRFLTAKYLYFLGMLCLCSYPQLHV